MRKIVFATNNANKLSEIREMLSGSGIEVLSPGDIGCHEDIAETGTTLEENALIKARYVYDNYHTGCFADDTGLEVEALGGQPGVYSARYAGGEGHDSERNMDKLLANLDGCDNRRARFRTVVALVTADGDGGGKAVTRLFEGTVNGVITTGRHGSEGFGYDPIFRPDGYDKTFAELGHTVKNRISHRAKAVEQLVNYLKSLA